MSYNRRLTDLAAKYRQFFADETPGQILGMICPYTFPIDYAAYGIPRNLPTTLPGRFRRFCGKRKGWTRLFPRHRPESGTEKSHWLRLRRHSGGKRLVPGGRALSVGGFYRPLQHGAFRLLEISWDPNCPRLVGQLKEPMELHQKLPLMIRCTAEDVYRHIGEMKKGRVVLMLNVNSLEEVMKFIQENSI